MFKNKIVPQENLSKKYFSNFKIIHKKLLIITSLLAVLYIIVLPIVLYITQITFLLGWPSSLSYHEKSINPDGTDPVIETNKNEYLPGEPIKIKIKFGKKIGGPNVPTIQIYGEERLQWQQYASECIRNSLCHDFIGVCSELSPSIIQGEFNQLVYPAYPPSSTTNPNFPYFIKPGEYKVLFAYAESTNRERCKDKGNIAGWCVSFCEGEKTISKTIIIKDFGGLNNIIAYSIFFLTQIIPFIILYIILIIAYNVYNSLKKH